MTFKALLATKDGEKISTDLVELEEKDLMPGEVTIAVDYSTVNYKDGMAITGRAPIIRAFPLIPGIDLSGTVQASSYSGIEAGDRVVANGRGLGQTHNGGYAQKARLSGDWLVKIPRSLSSRDAMAIGTAGYTAMLSVLALEHGGITPDRGDILVTGASGGVGSMGIALLSELGYRVVASTGRLEEVDYLRKLGAANGVCPAYDLRAGGASRECAMGLCGGLCRQPYSGERAGPGPISRRCGGVRPGSGLRSSGNRASFHLGQRTIRARGGERTASRPGRSAWSRLARDLDLRK